MLLPLIVSFPLIISIWQGNEAAIFTNKCAGRAWNPCRLTTITVRVTQVSTPAKHLPIKPSCEL
jgi:hypothetical protein